MKAFLIDFENVKSKGLTGIEELTPEDKVIIFYSENSDTISFDMHRKVLTCRADIEYLKVRVGGKNALDFQLSTLLGYILAKGKYESIFIISGDKGFDKLHDFWNISFADRNTITVFRTQTISAALAYSSQVRPVPEPEPEAAPEPAEEAAEPAAEAPAEPKPVAKLTKRRTRKLQPASVLIRNALLGVFDLTDKDVDYIVTCAAESEDKEDLHNMLAKTYKAQATELYKVLRPKYLRIKEALEAEAAAKAAEAAEAAPEEAPAAPEETPAAEPAPEPAAEAAAPEQEEKPAKKKQTRKKTARRTKKAAKSPLAAELERRLADECSAEEIAAVTNIFEQTDSKQKLYLSIVKEYKKDRGCEIYKLIKSDYTALAKLKEEG